MLAGPDASDPVIRWNGMRAVTMELLCRFESGSSTKPQAVEEAREVKFRIQGDGLAEADEKAKRRGCA